MQFKSRLGSMTFLTVKKGIQASILIFNVDNDGKRISGREEYGNIIISGNDGKHYRRIPNADNSMIGSKSLQTLILLEGYGCKHYNKTGNDGKHYMHIPNTYNSTTGNKDNKNIMSSSDINSKSCKVHGLIMGMMIIS